LFASSSYAEPGAIASRTANVEGVQLHYLTAGHGPARFGALALGGIGIGAVAIGAFALGALAIGD
jgi:hypothetical protein